mmetsp:Transcript_23315/g.49293  ORF Transcript_23315/g.49293 Transcript_23315/m.49293 type:complete len:389 (+) Transcript_23315:243-1409(+)
MASRPLIVFVFLTGVSMLSTVVVVGFAAPPLSSSVYSSSFGAIATTLRYAAETSYQDEQYYRSRPNDMKVVDVEVEGNSQYVYIPLHEMEDAVNKAQETHEQDCADLQKTINEQRREVQRLKERNQKSRLADGTQYDHLSENTEVNWGENHDQKMKRTTDRVLFLTNENERLQSELNEERGRFELEKARLQHKLEQAREETAEAQQILSVERSYFETAIKLLEVGLERETKNVKVLEDQLMQSNQHEFDGNDHYHPFPEDLRHYDETWKEPGAYEQQQGHQHHHQHHDFHHHLHHHQEEFDEFEPRVRPQNYHQDDESHLQHEALFQSHEPQPFHAQHIGQTTQQHPYPMRDTNSIYRRPATVSTTVMGASSIRDNLGINNIRDSFYR